MAECALRWYSAFCCARCHKRIASVWQVYDNCITCILRCNFCLFFLRFPHTTAANCLLQPPWVGVQTRGAVPSDPRRQGAGRHRAWASGRLGLRREQVKRLHTTSDKHHETLHTAKRYTMRRYTLQLSYINIVLIIIPTLYEGYILSVHRMVMENRPVDPGSIQGSHRPISFVRIKHRIRADDILCKTEY